MIIVLIILASVIAAAVGVVIFLQILTFDIVSELRSDLRGILENSEQAARTHNSTLAKAVRSTKNAKS